jgi:histidine kinase/DNA gyrase B/HSP90-like ATPase
MFNTAANAGGRLWLAGCWIRATLLAGIWVTLAWMPAGELPRAAVQLAVSTAALALAFAHITPGGLDLVARVPGTRPLVRHMEATSGRATVDVPGLAEGLGAFLATSLFVGWFPVPGLPLDVRSVGLALAVGYCWEAVLQAVIDPGWYSLRTPPSRGMRVFRFTIPIILSGLITLVLLPWTHTDTQVPLALRILLSISPLAYYLVWATFDVMLKAAAMSLWNSRNLWRWHVWGDVHGTVKNTLVFLKQYVEDPAPDLEEIRSLVRNALIVVEDFKGNLIDASGQRTEGGTVGELFESIWHAFGSSLPVTYDLDGDSERVRLSAADYQIARRVVPDLISNAIKAGASAVDARFTVVKQPAQIRVEVSDNGVGMPEDAMDAPDTSLRRLQDRLRQRDGDVTHARNDTGGITATAQWRMSDSLGVTPG